MQGGMSYHIVGPRLLGTTRPTIGATNVGRLFSVAVTVEQEQTNKQTKTKQNKTKQKRHLDPLCVLLCCAQLTDWQKLVYTTIYKLQPHEELVRTKEHTPENRL